MITLKDLKQQYDNFGGNRYVVVISSNDIPLFICKTYEEALETVIDENKRGFRMCKVVDLLQA